VEHVQPANVACRDELDQSVQNREGLAICPALLCLADAVTECVDGFLVSDVRGAGKVRSRFTKPTSSE
jgi:hypothetical protein